MQVVNVLFILQSFFQLRLRIVGQGAMHCWRGEGKHVNVGVWDLFKRWMQGQDWAWAEEDDILFNSTSKVLPGAFSLNFLAGSKLQTQEQCSAERQWMNECTLQGLFLGVLDFFSSCSAARSWQGWGWCWKGSATITIPAKFVLAIFISQKYVWW